MNERAPQPNPETQRPSHQLLQYKDGRLAYGQHTEGSVLDWHNKWTEPHNSGNTVIVRLVSGRNIAVGSGVIVELPDFDREKGEFKVVGKQVNAALVTHELPSVSVGEPWQLMQNEDAVTSFVYGYKGAQPGYDGAEQVDGLNPFDSAHELLERVANTFAAQGQGRRAGNQ